MTKHFPPCHNINYTLMILKYNRYTINIKSFLRVETGDFPFIIKDLRQRLSKGVDKYHAKKTYLPPAPAKYFGTPALSYTL